nr:MAG TPA: hypothetical protein [Caudoviricetes sp.]
MYDICRHSFITNSSFIDNLKLLISNFLDRYYQNYYL